MTKRPAIDTVNSSRNGSVAKRLAYLEALVAARPQVLEIEPEHTSYSSTNRETEDNPGLSPSGCHSPQLLPHGQQIDSGIDRDDQTSRGPFAFMPSSVHDYGGTSMAMPDAEVTERGLDYAGRRLELKQTPSMIGYSTNGTVAEDNHKGDHGPPSYHTDLIPCTRAATGDKQEVNSVYTGETVRHMPNCPIAGQTANL